VVRLHLQQPAPLARLSHQFPDAQSVLYGLMRASLLRVGRLPSAILRRAPAGVFSSLALKTINRSLALLFWICVRHGASRKKNRHEQMGCRAVQV
jgi:hypothetical protein